MDMTPKEYQQYVEQKAKKSPLAKDMALAFAVGGLICVLGQAIQAGWMAAGLGKEDAGTATSCTLVLLSALLTGLNLYNKIIQTPKARAPSRPNHSSLRTKPEQSQRNKLTPSRASASADAPQKLKKRLANAH